MLTYAEPSRREGTPIPRSPDFSQEARPLNVLDLVKLTPLMELTSGRPEIAIAPECHAKDSGCDLRFHQSQHGRHGEVLRPSRCDRDFPFSGYQDVAVL
jgi:hypothetical protein